MSPDRSERDWSPRLPTVSEWHVGYLQITLPESLAPPKCVPRVGVLTRLPTRGGWTQGGRSAIAGPTLYLPWRPTRQVPALLNPACRMALHTMQTRQRINSANWTRLIASSLRPYGWSHRATHTDPLHVRLPGSSSPPPTGDSWPWVWPRSPMSSRSHGTR